MTCNSEIASDLNNILERTRSLWAELNQSRIFFTGGTGFFGRWMLESFVHANQTLGLKAQAVVLTRNPEAFRCEAPHLANLDCIQLHHGGITDFRFPRGNFTHLVHAASELSSSNPVDPLGLLSTTIDGTRRVCDFAGVSGAKKLLFTSSGAVYGALDKSKERFFEQDAFAQLPLNSRSAYGEAKRLAELICSISGQYYGFNVKIARGFSFLGPFMSLNYPFAASSFFKSALNGDQIVVQGHGQNIRSYLYGADLAIWLWTILFKGESEVPYNLGSDMPVTIQQLAQMINAAADSHTKVEILGKLESHEKPEAYLPSIERARNDLDLDVFTSLDLSVEKTLNFYRNQ